jgi:hypothetical protein
MSKRIGETEEQPQATWSQVSAMTTPPRNGGNVEVIDLMSPPQAKKVGSEMDDIIDLRTEASSPSYLHVKKQRVDEEYDISSQSLFPPDSYDPTS